MIKWQRKNGNQNTTRRGTGQSSRQNIARPISQCESWRRNTMFRIPQSIAVQCARSGRRRERNV
nr:MAG TPA: hypothetical protein [Caudoviricetes sp.]